MTDFEQKKALAEVIVGLKEGVETCEDLKARFYQIAIEAAKEDDDVMLKECEEGCYGITNFISGLKRLSLNVEKYAVTASACAELNKLPKAMKACFSMLNRIPNLDGLKDSFGKLSKKLSRFEFSIGSIFEDSKKNKKDQALVEKIFGKSSVDDPKRKKFSEDFRKNIEASLMKDNVTPVGATAVNAVGSELGAGDVADIDALAKMLDGEKNKP